MHLQEHCWHYFESISTSHKKASSLLEVTCNLLIVQIIIAQFPHSLVNACWRLLLWSKHLLEPTQHKANKKTKLKIWTTLSNLCYLCHRSSKGRIGGRSNNSFFRSGLYQAARNRKPFALWDWPGTGPIRIWLKNDKQISLHCNKKSKFQLPLKIYNQTIIMQKRIIVYSLNIFVVIPLFLLVLANSRNHHFTVWVKTFENWFVEHWLQARLRCLRITNL